MISVHPEIMSQNRPGKRSLLPADSIFPLPDSMKEHLTAFVKPVNDELPDKMIYKIWDWERWTLQPYWDNSKNCFLKNE